MKKTWILGLALCLTLGGCTVRRNSEDSDTEDLTVQLPASYQIALDAAEARATYYEELAVRLEEEILSVRTELFSNRVEYEGRIDALEEELKDALAQRGENPPADTEEDTALPPADTESPETDPYADFQFLVQDGRAILSAYVGRGTAVVIPASYRGCPVVAIADRAFEGKTRLQSVVLPSGLETVGWFAFSGCIALREVTMPESVRSVSYGAFLNCNSAMVLRCAVGSYAEQYAQSYGIATEK